MPRTRSNLSPVTAPKVAEASRLSSSQNQKQDASATLSPAPKGRNIPAQGIALGHRPPTDPSPERAGQGWPFVRLAEAGVISGGLTKNSKRDSNELQVSYLRVGNVYQNELRLDEIKTIGLTEREFAKTRLEKGDLLIVEGNGSKDQIGRLAIWDGSVEPCVHQNHLIRVRLSERVLPKFAVYWFSSQEGRARIEQVASSTSGLYTLSVSKIGSLELPLPPLPEQRRIVARIEELFSRLDAGVAALRHAKAQLQRYRQSVLAAAVTGQLTQAWREQHPDTERPNQTAELFGTPLPESWECSPLKTVVNEGPRNGFSPLCGTETSGSKVLKLSATSSGRMLLNEKTTKYSVSPVDPGSHAWLQPDDVLIQRANSLELLGSTAIYEGPKDEYVYPDLMMRVRISEPITRKILVIYLNCLPARNYFQRNATGVAGNMPKINGAIVKELPVPIPPLAEQHQIVAEVEARTSAIDHLEAELDRQITRSNLLRKSTLAHAFSGRLQ